MLAGKPESAGAITVAGSDMVKGVREVAKIAGNGRRTAWERILFLATPLS
jgi:hypothetical protein